MVGLLDESAPNLAGSFLLALDTRWAVKRNAATVAGSLSCYSCPDFEDNASRVRQTAAACVQLLGEVSTLLADDSALSTEHLVRLLLGLGFWSAWGITVRLGMLMAPPMACMMQKQICRRVDDEVDLKSMLGPERFALNSCFEAALLELSACIRQLNLFGQDFGQDEMSPSKLLDAIVGVFHCRLTGWALSTACSATRGILGE